MEPTPTTYLVFNDGLLIGYASATPQTYPRVLGEHIIKYGPATTLVSATIYDAVHYFLPLDTFDRSK